MAQQKDGAFWKVSAVECCEWGSASPKATLLTPSSQVDWKVMEGGRKVRRKGWVDG